MAEGLPSRQELLERLSEAIDDRSVNVTAIKVLLEELRRDEDGAGGSEFDELDNVKEFRRVA